MEHLSCQNGVYSSEHIPLDPNKSVDDYIAFNILVNGDIRQTVGYGSNAKHPNYSLRVGLRDSRGQTTLVKDVTTLNKSWTSFVSEFNRTAGTGSDASTNSTFFNVETSYDHILMNTLIKITVKTKRQYDYFYFSNLYLGDNLTYNRYVKSVTAYRCKSASFESRDPTYSTYTVEDKSILFSGSDEIITEYKDAYPSHIVMRSLFSKVARNVIFNRVYIDDNGYYRNCEVGTYKYVARGYTKENKEYRKEVTIKVQDTKGPNILPANGTWETRFSYDDYKSHEDIKKMYQATDPSGVKEFDIKYNENALRTVGSHKVIFFAKDAYDNITNKTIDIFIYDEKAPEIIGDSTISTNIRNPILKLDVLKRFTALDEHDGKVDVKILEDYYTDNAYTLGTHNIVLSSKDKSGNESKFKVDIWVQESNFQEFFFRDGTLEIYKGSAMSNEEVIRALQKAGHITSEEIYTKIERVKGYSIDGSLPTGTYNYKFKCTNENGSNDIVDVILKVSEKLTEQVQQEQQANSSSKNGNAFVNFFSNLWNNIKNFFKNLFKKK